MRLPPQTLALLASFLLIAPFPAVARTYSLDEAISLAQTQNPEIAIAQKKLEAARGGLIEARSGYLPSVVSSGLAREREHQSDTRLRDEDYNASIRLVQSLYTGGGVPGQVSIAQLRLEQQELEVKAISNRVLMDVRVAFNQILLDRAKIRVHEQSVSVLQEEFKTQEERFKAGLVGQLNVRRAEVAAANEQTELIDAQTHLKNSYLQLSQLLGTGPGSSSWEVSGQLQYQPRHPDLNECLARADTTRPEILLQAKEIQIEDQQEIVDRSSLRPQVEAFSGYELYNERDPSVGHEFNHGYVLGLNATWRIFDGFATKGRVIATRARRSAAEQTLKALKLSISSEVRSAFLDLQQADQVMQSETKNVQTADESLEIAKANLAAGLGTQLDILQASSDVTRTRTTRLSAIYLHNVAVAHLSRACATTPEALGFGQNLAEKNKKTSGAAVHEVAQPPAKLSRR
jgi:outer membrane protein